mmetsp:Transcript_6776/g.18187  ORF Transcript_6776/g.18187 Transcript_6776/m.18187 type:complete len:154 (+) Transcript_6776:111-572(+)
MSYAGALGAGTIGSVAGYLIGSSSGQGDAPGVTPISAGERRDIDSLRAEAQFRREYDGHVWVRARSGDWWEARLDAQVPGTVLLRNPEGYVYFLNLNIQQIDLTDDYVMAAVFGDGSWEANVQRVQAKDDASGEPVDLQMPMDAFRDLISLMS